MSKKKSKACDAACPCGSGLALAACCGRLHAGVPAETRPAVLFEDGEERPKWLSLVIHSSYEEGAEGRVSFTARGRTSQGAFRLEENSRFRLENGRWLYVDGTFDDR